VTKQNADGSYDEVGMNNRCIISGYKTFRNAFKYGINPFGNGKTVRVEVYNENVFAEPLGVHIMSTTRTGAVAITS
jgi:hypothetical protein